MVYHFARGRIVKIILLPLMIVECETYFSELEISEKYLFEKVNYFFTKIINVFLTICPWFRKFKVYFKLDTLWLFLFLMIF